MIILYECARCGAALPLDQVVPVREPVAREYDTVCDEQVVSTERFAYLCLACKERR